MGRWNSYAPSGAPFIGGDGPRVSPVATSLRPIRGSIHRGRRSTGFTRGYIPAPHPGLNAVIEGLPE